MLLNYNLQGFWKKKKTEAYHYYIIMGILYHSSKGCPTDPDSQSYIKGKVLHYIYINSKISP